jgi:hypothetical protein
MKNRPDRGITKRCRSKIVIFLYVKRRGKKIREEKEKEDTL